MLYKYITKYTYITLYKETIIVYYYITIYYDTY